MTRPERLLSSGGMVPTKLFPLSSLGRDNSAWLNEPRACSLLRFSRMHKMGSRDEACGAQGLHVCEGT